MITLMDCTLRDGANVVGKGFSAEITDMVLDGLTACHVPIIEFGNAGGIGAYLMSRFLALGMTFEDVLACCSSTPAKMMGMENEIGCLKPGARGNIAVFKRKKGRFTFADVRDSRVTGNELLVPVMTLWEGDLVYRNGE